MTALSRRSTGRIIALGASLTIALAGSAALATAASAEPGKGQGQGQEQNKPAETGKPGDSSKPAETGGNQGGGNAGGNDGGSKPGQEVCGPLDSGKIDYSGGTVTVTAPAGSVVTGYCVKAGSDQSTTDGAVQYVTLADADRAQSVTFGHYSGKSISHYSFSWAPAGTIDVCPTVPGDQTTFPYPNNSCSQVIDVCPTVPGDQATFPYPNNSCTAPQDCVDGSTGAFGGELKLCDPLPEGDPQAPTVAAAGTTAGASGPETVNAVAPATVAKPAPAKVAVPAKATLPAAVPAGGGSTQNGAPMVALAMIAAAALAAAGAGARLARNS